MSWFAAWLELPLIRHTLRNHSIIDDEIAALPANERAYSERKEGLP